MENALPVARTVTADVELDTLDCPVEVTETFELVLFVSRGNMIKEIQRV
jgi:hypothetical protein